MYSYFSESEMKCKCGCDKMIHNQTLLDMLNKARRLSGMPFIINSWYRCEDHNEAIGSKPTSSHVKGKAVDIAFKNSHDCYTILDSLFKAGFVRIGINFKKKFLHVDVDMDKIKEVIFSY